MQLPLFLKPYEQEAMDWLTKESARQIEFSGATYQIQIVSPQTDEEAWAFLQLDSTGYLSDGFCSGEECDASSGCIHLAVAFLRIYNGYLQPLHIRFANSLWNALCRLYADKLGYDSEILKKEAQGGYASYSVGRKRLFAINPLNQAAERSLKEVFEKKNLETEETSLKFSNLSQEELILWREGRPTPQLSYELSFWNDLAKWLMLLQDSREPYTIKFGYSQRHLPNQIEIAFDSVVLDCYLAEATLSQIIPTLKTVKSPLSVHDEWQESIQSIVYHKREGAIHIVTGKKNQMIKNHEELRKNAILHGEWLFVPSQGFYANDPQQLVQSSVISTKEIGPFLSEHTSLIKKYLKGCSFNTEPLKLSYRLFLTKNGAFTLSHIYSKWVI